jgi:ribulose-bisphosphate carboxylase large chain
MNFQFQTENILKLSGKRFSVHYEIYAENETVAHEKAKDICVEQTIEFPLELIPSHIKEEGIVGRIESFKKETDTLFLCQISYANECAGDEITQFINVVFGNISIKPGIKVVNIELNDQLDFILGPRFGVLGLRKFWNIFDRPIICSALKPMGLSANDLAILAGDFAKGGIDLIKDDHGLSNQKFSTFKERVEKCQKRISDINNTTVYAPNITGPHDQIRERAYFAKEMGCRALLISPLLSGFDVVHSLACDNNLNLPIIAHPAFMGSFVTSKENGFSHYALFGQLMRIIGADVTIYPNFGGRFSFSKDECLSIVKGASDPLSKLNSIFPSPGGGMTFSNIDEMQKVYGKDVIYLMGGGLFKNGPDLVKNTNKLKHFFII